MARSIAGAVLSTVVGLALATGGCTQLNASHCGNQQHDLTCENRNEATPFCDKCEAANDGCVAERPSEAACGFAETSSSSGPPELTTSTSSSSSTETADTADTTETADGSSTGLPDLCGNGVIDPEEACDGDVVPEGASCTDEGFGKAIPGCVDDCSTLNYTMCPEYDECGNDEVALGEECDGTNLQGETCGDFPNLTGGGLACSPRCTFDIGACLACIENTEECNPGQDVCCDPMASCGGVLTKECCLPGMCPLAAAPVFESFEP